MLCSARRARLLRRPRRHHRTAGRCAGRQALSPNVPASAIRCIEINLTPNRADCTGVHGIARDLAAAGIGKLKDHAPKPVKGDVPLPGEGDARFGETPSLCPGFCAAAGARRQERPVAGMAAEAADRDRAAARSTRWSTSPISSPSTAAGRCTCSTPRRCTGNLTVRRAQRRREAAGARRQDLRARRRRCASSPTTTASNRSPASWAAKPPAATRTPPTC